MNRPEDWQAALSALYPVVTDAALDSIEAEAQTRYQQSRDPWYATCVTALRSLRQEIAKMEHAWLMLDGTHKARLIAELAARDRAIEILTSPEHADAEAAA